MCVAWRRGFGKTCSVIIFDMCAQRGWKRARPEVPVRPFVRCNVINEFSIHPRSQRKYKACRAGHFLEPSTQTPHHRGAFLFGDANGRRRDYFVVHRKKPVANMQAQLGSLAFGNQVCNLWAVRMEGQIETERPILEVICTT